MTEQVPHIDFDWKQCNERLANRSPREKFYETMVAATNELVADLQNENQMLKNQLDCEKEKNEYLMKIMEQYGIPAPNISLGIPPSVPIKTKKNAKSKEKQFKELVQVDDKENILKRLHKRIDGNGGKDVALVLLRALKDKLISRLPSERVFKTEFKNIMGEWRSISYYLNPNCSPTPDCSTVVI